LRWSSWAACHLQSEHGGVAHLVERLVRNQQARGSKPRSSTLLFFVFLLCTLLFLTDGRQWCIGNIEASQALAPGSTPGWRITLLRGFYSPSSWSRVCMCVCVWFVNAVPNPCLRGCSSNGRAPALHAGGTGIDTLLLHFFLFSFFAWGSKLNSVVEKRQGTVLLCRSGIGIV
jgi:hypothetical protein